jgi:hypothetical protein
LVLGLFIGAIAGLFSLMLLLNLIDLPHEEPWIPKGLNGRIIIMFGTQLLLFIPECIFQLDLNLVWVDHFSATIALVFIMARIVIQIVNRVSNHILWNRLVTL